MIQHKTVSRELKQQVGDISKNQREVQQVLLDYQTGILTLFFLFDVLQIFETTFTKLCQRFCWQLSINYVNFMWAFLTHLSPI